MFQNLKDTHVKYYKSECAKKKAPHNAGLFSLFLAEWTGLEPATPGVTGRYSNQLNYHSALNPTPDFCPKLLPLPALKAGVPTGIRTPVIAVKGRCPRPLDDGDLLSLVEVSGIEPLTSCMPCKRSPS